MKVLQINATYGYGSTGRNVKEQHEYYLAKGIDSYVAYAIRGKKSERIFRIGTTLDHKMHAIMWRITGKQGYYSYFATKKLLRRMKKIQPDIVHLHNLHSNYINLPILLKYLAKQKITTIITLHDFWFFTGRCYHYLYDDCDKYKKECGECPFLKRTHCLIDFSRKMLLQKKELFSQIEKLGVIGVSRWSIEETKKSFLKDKGIKTYIYNWVDRQVFYPRVVQNDTSKKKIIAVSQIWGEEKGLKEAIRLAELLGKNTELLLIGNIVGSPILPSNIRVIGYIDDVNTLAEYYSAADCFVHFSLVETFGKVIVEAMACGTPVVVFNSTALSELIGEECGEVVDANDILAMSRAVKRILSKDKSNYLDVCTAWVEKNFSSETQIEKHLDFYKKFLL